MIVVLHVYVLFIWGFDYKFTNYNFKHEEDMKFIKEKK